MVMNRCKWRVILEIKYEFKRPFISNIFKKIKHLQYLPIRLGVEFSIQSGLHNSINLLISKNF